MQGTARQMKSWAEFKLAAPALTTSGKDVFELFVERAMVMYVVAEGTPEEHLVRMIWPACKRHVPGG